MNTYSYGFKLIGVKLICGYRSIRGGGRRGKLNSVRRMNGRFCEKSGAEKEMKS